MVKPEIPTPPPIENTTPRAGAGDANQWIMKNLNDLRDDVRGLNGAVSDLGQRVGTLEKTIMRVVYTFAGITLTIAVLWAGYRLMTNWFEFTITPKSPESQEAPPPAP